MARRFLSRLRLISDCGSVPREPPRSAVGLEFSAFEILEEGRVTCAILRDHDHDPVRRGLWSQLHRDLGLAGYHLSERLEPHRRRRSSALAWETSCEPSVVVIENVLRIRDGVERARDILTDVRMIAGDRDDLSQALLSLSEAPRHINALLSAG